MSDEAKAEVISAVKRWARAFGKGDADGIMAMWDRDYPELIHQAEEYPDPLRGWDEIEYYNRQFVQNASGHRDPGVADFLADVIGDVAWCYLRGSITFDWASLNKPIQGQVSQLFILRRRDGEWRIIQYHEGRETPGLRDAFRVAHPNPDRMTEAEPQSYLGAYIDN